MRIGIEGKVLTPNIGGIGRCAINLLRAILPIAAEERPDMEFVIFTAPQTAPGVLDNMHVSVDNRFQRVRSTLLRSSFLLPVGLLLERIDVFHGLDQAGIPFFFKKGKYVVTLHDVIALARPEMFPRKQRWVLSLAISHVIKQADVIIVPSHAVREDVLRYLKVERDKVTVLPWGCEARFQPSGEPERFEEVRRRYGLPPWYVLFLGTLEPRKNVTTLLKAFSLLRAEQRDMDLTLVIAGGRGWGDEGLFSTVKDLGLQAHVIFTGFVADEDLPDLYRGGLLFVYPSLYEGFGLPILEAMGCGVPVIASNTSSMPEVAGDAAILVEPTKPEALASAMASVLGSEALREELRWKGIARARGFSWETVARRTLELYQTLGGY